MGVLLGAVFSFITMRFSLGPGWRRAHLQHADRYRCCIAPCGGATSRASLAVTYAHAYVACIVPENVNASVKLAVLLQC